MIKKISIVFLVFGLFVSTCFANPSNSISLTNAASKTTISSSDYNSNNNAITSSYNNHTHTDITQLGTVNTGTWAATVIGTLYGGTGQDFSSQAQGVVPYFSATGVFSGLAVGTKGQCLTTGGVAANPSWTGMTTQGDIEYHNGTTRTRLAAGTSGYFLKTNGAGANPSWSSLGNIPVVGASNIRIDYGTQVGGGAGVETTITYNVTFASTPVVIVTLLDTDTTIQHTAYLTSIGTTTCKAIHNQSSITGTFQWIAIGPV